MIYDILATGSTGNSVVIKGEILIDCGIPMKKQREIGYIKGLRLVLLTHAHGDHFNAATVRALHQERPALKWGCCKWMVPHLLGAGVLVQLIRMPTKREVLRMQEYTIFPVDLVHDVPNCGWHIWTERQDGQKAIVWPSASEMVWRLQYIPVAKEADAGSVQNNRSNHFEDYGMSTAICGS